MIAVQEMGAYMVDPTQPRRFVTPFVTQKIKKAYTLTYAFILYGAPGEITAYFHVGCPSGHPADVQIRS